MSIQSNKKYKRVIQLELNEISAKVVNNIIQRKHSLPNFAKINQEWKYLTTSSEANYSDIEPWIQWVTVHTGKTLTEHEIFRLSDAHKLKHPQTWEVLSQSGVESAIIGSMNVTRGDCRGGMFFPDPWSQSNAAYPEEIKPLWTFIAQKVQQHATTAKLSFSDLLKVFRICRKIGLPKSIYLKVIKQIISQKINFKNKWRLAGVFDLFLAEIFKAVLRSTNYGFYTLFLNSIAHYQHHYWRAFDSQPFNNGIKYNDICDGDNPMLFGYQIYDKIIGELMELVANDKDTLVIILSGLSQVPYDLQEDVGGMNYYRLNNHQDFARSIGLTGEVFPMMSRDWQYKYNSGAEKKAALKILKAVTVGGEPLFALNENTEGYIYVETAYTKGDSDELTIHSAGKELGRLSAIFTNIAIKSGHHTGIGSIWVSDPEALNVDQNSQIDLAEVFNFAISALVQDPL